MMVICAGAYAFHHDLYGVYLSYRASEGEVRMLAEQVKTLEERQSGIEEDVSELQDDPLELEAEIRKTKRLVRPGETIYRVSLPDSR